ncbi:uncharacterized protein [Aegilops tauschii subsp. strangulata]|nr:uncharacterized protein LOC109772195 [Aegilops tauschii subsp. strangulata]XP_044376829.1 uncharacterized protein LOC123098818 isoform X1 [Triticum aestivum]XP_045083942.1 uncharacterized protein LOC109772195 [Aegilops tauschii subsp. strangulata]
MPATMPLTLSLPRLLLLHRRRHAKVQQPRSLARLRCAPDEVAATTAEQRQGEGEEEELVLLASYRTAFNEVIMVIDSPSNRYLVLDPTRNVHSILPKKGAWTNSYWDECVSLPTVVPRGPVALLGLGAGTAAHMMLEVWPWIQLIGWEIDPTVIELSRDYFGMSTLEKTTELGGSLSVHIGDALSPSATVEGGFAGIVVDLFADGEVLPQLQEVDTWLEIAKKLMPDGRIMVNCGAGDAAVSLAADADVSSWVQNPTIKALCSAFPGQLNWKRLSEKESVNYVALTGPLPDLEEWSASVPSELSLRVKQWVPCKLA